ncbi:hypothetical protein HZB01_00545 [Candidatus Woesearchaeota archaeon]|nr:hypothetical protein [Candidatus Woesearchaeota archaeon]
MSIGSKQPESKVTYLQGVQAVASSDSSGVVIGEQPYVRGLSFKYDQGINLDERVEKADGIAHVAVFEQAVDLRTDFISPANINQFNGDVNAGGKTREIFERYFRNAVNNEGRRIEQEKDVKVSGVVLSHIKVQKHLVDALFTIATDKQGEYQLAATYLVGK